MNIDLNIKINGNAKVIIIWTIMLFTIIIMLIWLTNNSEGLIVLNKYTNCTLPKSSFMYTDFTDFT